MEAAGTEVLDEVDIVVEEFEVMSCGSEGKGKERDDDGLSAKDFKQVAAPAVNPQVFRP